jgi:hypothetical protein
VPKPLATEQNLRTQAAGEREDPFSIHVIRDHPIETRHISKLLVTNMKKSIPGWWFQGFQPL